MVVINGVKYACDRCIRGHRVSGCRHINQPLKMIKRKGRPPTQCTTCKKIRSKGPSSAATCACSEQADPPASDLLSRPEALPPSANQLGPGCAQSENQPKPELTPTDIAKLRKQPDVKIELPDGSILGPEPQIKTDPYSDNTHFALPLASAEYENDAHRIPPPPSVHGPPYAGPLPTHSEEDFLMPDRFRYQPHIYGRLAGPYNADLYNEHTGNNAAAAAMNARGDGGYVPNTGSVTFQPRLVLDNELAASTQELADSLSGIAGVKPQAQSSQEPEVDTVGDPNDPYASAHIPKLSNLY